MSVQILLMQRYLTNNFSQSESFQPLERMHFNNLIQPLETGSTIGFFQPLGLAKIGKKIQSIEILFQPLEIPTIEIGENTSYDLYANNPTTWAGNGLRFIGDSSFFYAIYSCLAL